MYEYPSILLSAWVVARDNANQALFLLIETKRNGTEEDIAIAEELYKEAKAADAKASAELDKSIKM